MGMVELLQEHQLVVHHLLVALDVLLQDDLYGHLAGRAVRFPNNAVGSRTLTCVLKMEPQISTLQSRNYQSAAHLVCGPEKKAQLLEA